jgi:ribokinase
MRVHRLPSRGETLLAGGYRADLGGKGSNQAVACARLGAKVSFVTKIGNDSFGDMAVRLYQLSVADLLHFHSIISRVSSRVSSFKRSSVVQLLASKNSEIALYCDGAAGKRF